MVNMHETFALAGLDNSHDYVNRSGETAELDSDSVAHFTYSFYSSFCIQKDSHRICGPGNLYQAFENPCGDCICKPGETKAEFLWRCVPGEREASGSFGTVEL